MGYRLYPPPEFRHHYDAAADKSMITVDNGTIVHLAIPCFYENGCLITRCHIMCIDHHGWPSPDSPDRSWQHCDHFDDRIFLEDEGYTGVKMLFDADAPEGLSAVGSIDVNIARISIKTECPDALTEDVETGFSIHIIGNDLNDTITRGILHIVAGPLG